MPIYKGTLKTGAAYKGNVSLQRIYKGAYLVFEAFKTLIAEGVPPLTLLNCAAEIMLGYRIYGNSVQNGTPTPSAPVEIESVGDKTKNLFDKTQVTLNARLYATGTDLHYDDTAKDFFTSEFIKVEPNTQYYYSKLGTNYTTRLIMANSNKGFIKNIDGNTNSIITTTSNTEYVIFNGLKSDIDNFMFAKSSNILDYEPYGYRIPVKKASSNLLPYPYILNSGTQGGIEITVNDDGSIKLNGTTTGFNAIVNTSFRLKAGTYTISGNPSPDVNLWLRVVGSSSSAGYVRNYNGIKGTLTIAEDSDMYVYITMDIGTTVNNVTIYPMVNEGETDLEYSKYFTPVTTNIYLDEPLRKLGDYADYLDFENQKVYRKIKKGVIDNNSTFGKFNGVTDYSAFYMAQDDLIDYYPGIGINQPMLSPQFAYHPAGGGGTNASWTGVYQISTSITSTYERILFSLPNTITDVASAKAWLQTNPVECYYPVQTPTEEIISLPDILLNKGTNIISVDTTMTPSNMWIKYKSK